MKKKNKPSALYIHIPFCQKICDYCDFPKLQYFRNLAVPYLKALNQEIAQRVEHLNLKTIYIGGGTPTALEDDLFEELLRNVQKYTKGVEEFTVECNPESLSDSKLALMKKYGVNRLSIGVQTTDDKILSLINRHHTWSDVKRAILSAKRFGFDNLNVDLIIGLPHANKERFMMDLDNILSLDVQHISCYSLTVHPHTVFHIKGIQEPLEDYSRELYEIAEKKLKENGFIHYEISNWAKPNRFSKHNLTYWKDQQYYGVGFGSAGYIDDVRYTNTRNFEKYCQNEYLGEQEIVSKEDDITYYIMLNLRTIFGINLKDYQEIFNEDFYESHKEVIEKYLEKNLLIYDRENANIYPSFDGMMILDQIIIDLLK